MITLSPDLQREVLRMVATEIAPAIVADLQLLTMREVAGLLKVSTTKARKLCKQIIILGEASDRVRVSDLRMLIDTRAMSRG